MVWVSICRVPIRCWSAHSASWRRVSLAGPCKLALAIAAIVKGGIDVLVNNAGYGYLTAFEEGDEAGDRDQFETTCSGSSP